MKIKNSMKLKTKDNRNIIKVIVNFLKRLMKETILFARPVKKREYKRNKKGM